MLAEVVYVRLPAEAVEVYAPVDAEYVRDGVYRIVDCRGEDEAVELASGTVVRCRRRAFSEGDFLVAYENSNQDAAHGPVS
ncbi:MAG: hypothetical protein U1E21_05090 [Reyranellaceae bacterium]|jgi:hypothetical protein